MQRFESRRPSHAVVAEQHHELAASDETRREFPSHKDGRTVLIPHSPRLIGGDLTVLREAAPGVGVAQLPTFMIWKDIRAGHLIQVLPQWQPRSGIIHAVFPSRQGLLPSVRALLDFLARECAAQRQLISDVMP